MKMKIVEITEWKKDEWMMAGDSSHNGDKSVRDLLADEEDKKLYSDKEWTLGLPFECEAESKDEALEHYNEMYCRYDYLKAADCEFE